MLCNGSKKVPEKGGFMSQVLDPVKQILGGDLKKLLMRFKSCNLTLQKFNRDSNRWQIATHDLGVVLPHRPVVKGLVVFDLYKLDYN